MTRSTVVLIGFMGAGKSTVGRLVAQRMGLAFVDSDDAVEARAHRSVREIFALEGEATFRALEEETVLELLDDRPIVLALGGGSLGSFAVERALAGRDVVLIDVPLDVARARIGADPSRPMLAGDVEALYERRAPVYRRCARIVVAGDRAPQDVAQDIVARLSGAGPRLVVVGPPGAGTSTVGRLVADRLGVSMTDLDEAVERAAGKSAQDVFVDDGEAAYRALEHEQAHAALSRESGILVLGGGAVMLDDVREALEGRRVVFLDVAVADAAKRIGFDANPGLVLLNPRRSWIVQMNARRPRYQEVATWTLDTNGRSAQDVADELVGLLEGAEA